MDCCLCQSAPNVLDDPFLIVLLFHQCSQLDGRHRFAHARGMITSQGLIIHHLTCIDLAQVQMRVGEGLGDQIPTCIENLYRITSALGFNGCDPSMLDTDLELPGFAPKGSTFDENIEISHSGLLIARSDRGSGSHAPADDGCKICDTWRHPASSHIDPDHVVET